MIPRVYIDTSVIGGWLDEEFHEHSEHLFADFEAERVRSLLDRPALQKMEKIYLDEEAVLLAEAYIKEGIVGEANRVDAQHIAIATVQRVDVLVSWNFQHIVKWSRIRAFNSVNIKLGYPQLEIRSPQEVYYEKG